MNWSECNFVGVDLSRLAIRYARGVSERWGLGHCLNFVVDPAEECLANIIDSYPGEVRLVMVQFPTPFRFQNVNDDDDEDEDEDEDDETGKESVVQRGYNVQLPTDAKAGFMVSENLLSQIQKVISKSNGMLLLQSNCEDVAVHMRNTAIEKCGFHSHDASYPVVTSLDASTANMPKRALDYINMGGERAMGSGWSARPLLPHGGRTETEVACMLDEKPVHRCLLMTERGYLSVPFSHPIKSSVGRLESAGKDDAVFPKDHHLDAFDRVFHSLFRMTACAAEIWNQQGTTLLCFPKTTT